MRLARQRQASSMTSGFSSPVKSLGCMSLTSSFTYASGEKWPASMSSEAMRRTSDRSCKAISCRDTSGDFSCSRIPRSRCAVPDMSPVSCRSAERL